MKELLRDPERAADGLLRVVSIVHGICTKNIMMTSALTLLKHALVRLQDGREREAFGALKKVVLVGFSLACDFGGKIQDDKAERTVAKYLVELERQGIFDAADIADIKEQCALCHIL